MEETQDATISLESCLSMEWGLQSLVLIPLAPLIGQGLHLSCHFQMHSDQRVVHDPSAHRPCGASPELALESWTLKLSNPMSWGSQENHSGCSKGLGYSRGWKNPGCWVREVTRPPSHLAGTEEGLGPVSAKANWEQFSSCYAYYYFFFKQI